jgi:hypothetical protein
MFSVSLILPVMGKWLDEAKAKAIAEGIDPSQAEAMAGSETFMKVAIMPAILLVIFTIIYFVRKSKLKPAIA